MWYNYSMKKNNYKSQIVTSLLHCNILNVTMQFCTGILGLLNIGCIDRIQEKSYIYISSSTAPLSSILLEMRTGGFFMGL